MAKKYNSFLSGYKTYDTSKGRGNPREWKDSFYETMTGEEAEEILSHYRTETEYEILGVSRLATQHEIKKAYRALMMKWHPDRNPDNIEEATEMSKKITAAYTKLKED